MQLDVIMFLYMKVFPLVSYGQSVIFLMVYGTISLSESIRRACLIMPNEEIV